MITNIDRLNPMKRSQVEKCANIAGKFSCVKRMIVFGSSVSDDCHQGGDVDNCMDLDGDNRGMDIYSLSLEIYNVCENNCDLLTYGKLQGRNKKEIDEKGEVVYERK